jgi:hypothetical protein
MMPGDHLMERDGWGEINRYVDLPNIVSISR